MSRGERPIGAAKGKQPDAEALCQSPPPHRTRVAGPGAYNNSPRIGTGGPLYSMAGRTPHGSGGSQAPGPGSYDPPAAPGKAFSMSSRSSRASAADTPGPGAYDVRVSRQGPSATIRGRNTHRTASAGLPQAERKGMGRAGDGMGWGGGWGAGATGMRNRAEDLRSRCGPAVTGWCGPRRP